MDDEACSTFLPFTQRKVGQIYSISFFLRVRLSAQGFFFAKKQMGKFQDWRNPVLKNASDTPAEFGDVLNYDSNKRVLIATAII